MSYIRNTNNPEALYIWSDDSKTKSLTGLPITFRKVLAILVVRQATIW